MKFRLTYVYAALLILIAIILIFLVSTEKSKVRELKGETEMPNDSIHSSLKIPGAIPPNKENVSAEFKSKLEELRKKSERNPKDIDVLKDYGDFLASAHQLEEALKIYDKILKINQQDREVLFTIAFIYYNKQDFTQAELYTKKILATDNKDHEALYNLGAINVAKGNKIKAKEIWESLIKNQPETSSAELAKSSLVKLK